MEKSITRTKKTDSGARLQGHSHHLFKRGLFLDFRVIKVDSQLIHFLFQVWANRSIEAYAQYPPPAEKWINLF